MVSSSRVAEVVCIGADVLAYYETSNNLLLFPTHFPFKILLLLLLLLLLNQPGTSSKSVKRSSHRLGFASIAITRAYQLACLKLN
jgi:hypothetical protein